MKKCIYSAALLLALMLGACGDTTEENVGGTVEESGTEIYANQTIDDAVNEINQVIVDKKM